MSVDGTGASGGAILLDSTAADTQSPIESSPEKQLENILNQGGKKEKVLDLFQTFFGQNLVERVVKLGLCKEWSEHFESKQCLILMGAIGQSITLNDLNECYTELKTGHISRTILKYAKISRFDMWRVSQATQLSTDSLNKLIDLFRNPLQTINLEDKIHLGKKLINAQLHKKRSLSYTYYDYAIQELAKQGDQTRPEFFTASRELIARSIAYADPTMTRLGMITPRFDETTGKFNYYQLSSQVHHGGLHAYLLTPLDLNKGLPAQLVFRGTDCEHSTHRDLDPAGVGKRIFDNCAPRIQEMLTDYAKQVKNPKIEIIGHSLGATDAQRAAILLIDPANLFPYFEIKLFAFCSPKLEKLTVCKWEEHLKSLSTKEIKPKIHLNFSHHESDLITMAGHDTISGIEDYYVQTNYLIVKSPSGYTNTKLHHTCPFFKFGNFDFTVDSRTFEFYQSVSEKELATCIQKLETLQSTSKWYLTLKSYFVYVDNPKDIENRLEELKSKRERLKYHHNQQLNKSWLMWSAHNTVRYTLSLRSVLYPVFGWYTKIKDKKHVGG